MDVINEIDKRVMLLTEKEKKAKTKILKAQYSASKTSLVMLKIWIKEQDRILCPVCNANEVKKEYHSLLKVTEAKELKEPQMTRMPKSMKVAIQASANKHNEGNFNREVRDLIQIGLKTR